MGVRGLAAASRARAAESGRTAFVLLVLGQGFGPLRGQCLVVHGRTLLVPGGGSGVPGGGSGVPGRSLRPSGIPAGLAGFFFLKLCRPLRGQGFLIVLRHDVPRYQLRRAGPRLRPRRSGLAHFRF